MCEKTTDNSHQSANGRAGKPRGKTKAQNKQFNNGLHHEDEAHPKANDEQPHAWQVSETGHPETTKGGDQQTDGAGADGAGVCCGGCVLCFQRQNSAMQAAQHVRIAH